MSLRGTAAGRVSKIERKAVKNGLRGEKGKQEQRAGNNEGKSCRCSVVFGAKFGLLELLMRPSWKQRYRSGFHYWTRTLGHSDTRWIRIFTFAVSKLPGTKQTGHEQTKNLQLFKENPSSRTNIKVEKCTGKSLSQLLGHFWLIPQIQTYIHIHTY